MGSGRWQRWRTSLAHAFSTGERAEALGAEDVALLDRLAAAIARRGLVGPALLFLESLAPLNFLGSQALHAASPVLDLAGVGPDADRLAAILERREAVAVFRDRLEAAAAIAPAGRPPAPASSSPPSPRGE